MSYTPDCQDWATVTVRRPTNKTAAGTTRSSVSSDVAKARKLEQDVIVKKKVLSAESRTALVAGRVAKKWTQDQLNQQCAFAPHTIREIEAGRLQPTGPQLNRLRQTLGVALAFA